MTLAFHFLPGDAVKGEVGGGGSRLGQKLKQHERDGARPDIDGRLFRAIRKFSSVTSAHLSKNTLSSKTIYTIQEYLLKGSYKKVH